ncbi:MAG: DUF805 domain-containing protein [Flavobacteriaceae bacterium]
MIKIYINAFKQFSDFKTRTTRNEFWMFQILNMAVTYILVFIELFIPMTVDWISITYGLIALIPSIAISVRRLHDVNKPGWLILLIYLLGILNYSVVFLLPESNWILASVASSLTLGAYLFYLCLKRGTPGPNKYGPDPLYNEDNFIA